MEKDCATRRRDEPLNGHVHYTTNGPKSKLCLISRRHGFQPLRIHFASGRGEGADCAHCSAFASVGSAFVSQPPGCEFESRSSLFSFLFLAREIYVHVGERLCLRVGAFVCVYPSQVT